MFTVICNTLNNKVTTTEIKFNKNNGNAIKITNTDFVSSKIMAR
jgi:hypothetical protein